MDDFNFSFLLSTDVQSHEGSGLPLAEGVELLCRSQGLVAIGKPPGLRSHPNEGGRIDKGAMIAAPYDIDEECYTLPGGGRLHLLHRLDAPTSGVILLTLDEVVAARVRGLFARHLVRKTYEALVFGDVRRAAGRWNDKLLTVRSRDGARTQPSTRGQPAIVTAKCLAFGSLDGLPVSLLSLEPETGLTHQLRVQCAKRNFPIVGDATYGNFAWNRRAAKALGTGRLCLHAAAIRIDDQNGPLRFEAKCPPPECFRAAFRSA